MRERHQGRATPISRSPHAKPPRHSPTCRSCLGQQRITDTRLTPSRSSLIRPSKHQTPLTPITLFGQACVDPEKSHQEKDCSSVSAAPVENLRLYRAPFSVPSWAHHGKAFDNAYPGSYAMQICRTHSGGLPHPTKILLLSWMTFRHRS